MGHNKLFTQMTYRVVFEGKRVSHNESPFADSSCDHIALFKQQKAKVHITYTDTFIID